MNHDKYIEIHSPYWLDSEGNLFNANTNRTIKQDKFHKAKIKVDGKIVEVDLTEYADFGNDNYYEFKNSDENKETNILYDEKFWLFKCVETIKTYRSLEEASIELGINKNAIRLNLENKKAHANYKHFYFNPNLDEKTRRKAFE